MTVRDLGPLADGPLLLFGGPYSNLQATRAMREEAEHLGVPPRRIICTGDVVAYCADPEATVALVRDWGIHVVMGNCEESLGQGADDCGCGFDEGSTCERLSRDWYGYAQRALSAESRRWMRGLPRRLAFRFGGLDWRVVHGAVDDISRFLFASAPDAVLTAELDAAGADAVIAGHCGLPFTRCLGGRLWHNPGVIGMPANDGTPAVWFSLLEAGDGGVMLTHHRLSYDHRAAARRMQEEGLPQGYAAALETGLWPSLDMLPAAERAATSRPLRLDPVRFAPGAAVGSPA